MLILVTVNFVHEWFYEKEIICSITALKDMHDTYMGSANSYIDTTLCGCFLPTTKLQRIHICHNSLCQLR